MIILDASNKRSKQLELGWKLYPHQLAVIYQMLRVERTRQLPTGIRYFSELPADQIVFTEHGTLPIDHGLGTTVLFLALSEYSRICKAPISIVYNPTYSGLPPKCLPRVVLLPIQSRYRDGGQAMDLIVTSYDRLAKWQSDLASLQLDPESVLWITSSSEERMEEYQTQILCASKKVRRVVMTVRCAQALEDVIASVFWNRFVADQVEQAQFRIKCNFSWSIAVDSGYSELPTPAWSCDPEFLSASRRVRGSIDYLVEHQRVHDEDDSDESEMNPERFQLLTHAWDTSVPSRSIFFSATDLSQTLAIGGITDADTIDRIKEQMGEDCVICAEPIQYPTLTTCCHQVLCIVCVAKCIDSDEACPMCRASLVHLNQVCAIVSARVPVALTPAPISQPFRSMEQLDVITRLLKRIVSQVVEPRVLLIIEDEIVMESMMEYLSQEDGPGHSLGQDYAPFTFEVHPPGSETSMTEFRLMIFDDNEHPPSARYPWITHLILATDNRELEERATRIVCSSIPIGETSDPVYRFQLFTPGSRADASEGVLIANQASLYAAISNPYIAAMSDEISSEEEDEDDE